MLESKFKSKQREDFEDRGWKFITLNPGGGVPKGFPDTLCLSPNGYVCYTEWKQSKNAKKQPLQPYWHKWLNDRGHDAFFVYPENVYQWRTKILKNAANWTRKV